jgi:hypothetical protein
MGQINWQSIRQITTNLWKPLSFTAITHYFGRIDKSAACIFPANPTHTLNQSRKGYPQKLNNKQGFIDRDLAS